MTELASSPTPEEILIILESLPPGEARAAELLQRQAWSEVTVEDLAEFADDKVRQDPHRALQIAYSALEVAEALDKPVSVARGLRSIVQAMTFLGKFEEALPLSLRAYDLYHAAGQPLDATRTLLGRTHILASLGRYAEAAASAEQARRTFEQAGDDLQAGLVIMNLGNLAQRMDHYPVAEARYREALQIFERLDERDWEAHAAFNLGNALSFLDRPHDAGEMFERVRHYFESKPEPMMVAMLDCNVGFLQLRQCRYTEALRAYQRARQTFEELKMDKDIVQMDMEIADVYLDLNLLSEATDAYRGAAETFAGLGMNYESGHAWAQLALAEIRLGHYRSAKESLDRAHDIFEQEANPTWLNTCRLYEAMLCQAQGRHASALQFAQEAAQGLSGPGLSARRALAHITAAMASSSLELPTEAYLTEAEQILSEIDLPALVYHAKHLRGRALMQQGDPASALKAFEAAMQAAERVRVTLPGETLRTAYREDKLGAYQAAVALLLSNEAEVNVGRAFETIERAKALALAEQAELSPASSVTSAPSETENLNRLRAELNWCYTAFTDRHPESFRQDWGQLREAIRMRERAIAEILRRDTLTAAGSFLPESNTVIRLTDVQTRLADDEGIVEYFVADGEILALLIRAKGVAIYRKLGAASTIEGMVERLEAQFRKFAFGPEYARSHLTQLRETTNAQLAELYRILVAPLAHSLPPRLIIVPHGPLHYIPFHALFDGQVYLIERHQLSYTPSATLWAHCLAQTTSQTGSALVMAVPDERAPLAAREARQVHAMYPDARVFISTEATWENLRQHASEAGLLHVASHAVFREDNPLFSSLRLSDEWVTVNDLYQLRMPSSLVVLTGCETGVSRVAPGDELTGLAGAFLAVGAVTLVVSLWAVHDDTTAELIADFYRYLQSGLNPAAALRGAQLALLKAHSHPYYWAPFVVIGRA